MDKFEPISGLDKEIRKLSIQESSTDNDQGSNSEPNDEKNESKSIDSFLGSNNKHKDYYADVFSHLEIEKNKFNFLSSESKTSSTNTSYQDLPINFLHENSTSNSNDKEKSNQNISSFEQESNESNAKSFDFTSWRNDLKNNDLKKDVDRAKLNSLEIGDSNTFKDEFDSKLDYYKKFSSLNSTGALNKSYFADMKSIDDFKYDKLTSNYKFNENSSNRRHTSKSAFETDPDVLMLKKNGADQSSISEITKKYLSFNNIMTTTDLKQNREDRLKDTKFENEYLNIFSLKIKKNHELPEQRDSHNDTIESTHLNSDYTKCPVFPSEAYGSRPGVNISLKEGIYNRKTSDKYFKSLDPEDSKILDPESLKLMDKKLKKLIKKNLKEDLKSHLSKEEFNQNTESLSWDIPIESHHLKSKTSLNETSSTVTQITEAHPYPYLPLRDVPVHELVKKLRHEFELQGDVSCIPNGLNDIYSKIQTQFHNKNAKEKIKNSQDSKNLENFVKNPAKIFIENFSSKEKNNSDEPQESKLENEKEFDENSSRNQKITQIQEMISNQKEKHEKRIKALEKLVKFEKLQAQKLKKIMLLNENDPLNSKIYESFLQKNNLKFDDDYLLKLSHENEKIYEIIDSPKSVGKNRTTDLESQNDSDNLSREDNEESKENGESGIDSSESGSENVQNSKSQQITSWYFPIKSARTPPKAPISKPISYEYPISNRSVTDNGENRDFVNGLMADEMVDPYSRKQCLQDAFQIHKYEFLKRSKNRVKEIKLKEARRQVATELKTSSYSIFDPKAPKLKNSKQDCSKDCNFASNKRYEYFTIDKAPPFSHQKARQVMSSQEIKEQTKKKYQKLPEVQQRQLKQKLEESKMRNRIKSNLFKKTIQQKVLSSGPNFNLNFKALEHCV